MSFQYQTQTLWSAKAFRFSMNHSLLLTFHWLYHMRFLESISGWGHGSSKDMDKDRNWSSSPNQNGNMDPTHVYPYKQQMAIKISMAVENFCGQQDQSGAISMDTWHQRSWISLKFWERDVLYVASICHWQVVWMQHVVANINGSQLSEAIGSRGSEDEYLSYALSMWYRLDQEKSHSEAVSDSFLFPHDQVTYESSLGGFVHALSRLMFFFKTIGRFYFLLFKVQIR